MESVKAKVCSECSVSFTCGSGGKEGECWCSDLPRIMPLDFEKDCRCPDCLERIIDKKITDYLLTGIK